MRSQRSIVWALNLVSEEKYNLIKKKKPKNALKNTNSGFSFVNYLTD